MATKKPMKFKEGGRIKRFSTGTEVEGDEASPLEIYRRSRAKAEEEVDNPNRMRDVEAMGDELMKPLRAKMAANDFNQDTSYGVREALGGKRPPAQEFTQLPPSKNQQRSGLAGAVNKVQQKAPAEDRRTLEATMSRGSRPEEGINQIPGQSLTAEQREGINRGERVTGTETSRNVSNTLNALTPMGGGALKVGTEMAMANRGAKAVQAVQGEGKLSAAGQRLKNMEEVRNVANPGRAEAVMNPSAWAGGPKAMDKVAQIEEKAARAAQAEVRAAKALERRNARDPVMNMRPNDSSAPKMSTPKTPKTPKTAKTPSKGKASSAKYETDEPIDISFGYKRGGAIKKFAKGGSVSSASSRGDGIAIRGKTKGTISKMCGGGMTKGRK